MGLSNICRRFLGVLCLCVGLAFAPSAWAGGYSQGIQGAASAGVAGAMTARPDVPEAGYYNPAGFVLQRTWGVSVGGAAIFPFIRFEEPGSTNRTEAIVDGAFPPHLHAFGRTGDFGFGMYLGVPFGSSLRWPDDWEGRFEVTSTSLTAYEAAPSVAWKPTDWLAIGAGPRFVYSTVGFRRQIDTARPEQEASVALDASTTGVGGQVGIWGRPLEPLTVGLSWRSMIRLDFTGVARFENVPPEMQNQAQDSLATTTLFLPDRLAIGVAYELGATGLVSLDLEWNRWSLYESFDVAFEAPDGDGPDDIEEARNWENTLSMRLGVEFLSPIDGLAIRSGFAIDPSPAPEGTVTAAQPDMDRFITTLGVGYQAMDRLFVNLAYNYLILSRTASAADFAGIYDGQVHIFTLGLSFR